jgi:Protein of unknown function (DUF4242)
VNEFLVELYVSGAEPDGVERRAERAREAAVELTAAGTPVRFLRSIFVPADETCLFLFEAASIDAVRETARRAALRLDHVAEATVHAYDGDDPALSKAVACTPPSRHQRR